ncbi:MAG: alpha/beta hydrolase [Candidatus Marsarchaeota archaeon]|nr:alpha/beta hydrolase [Candidatus Marsarchaeota archaeon]
MDYAFMEDGFVDTSSGKLHYKRHRSDGKKMLFIHGFGANTRSFERLAGLLPDDMDICLIDLLGHGKSDAPHIEYSIELHAKLVMEFVEKEALQDAYLFGHSYGGWIAASIAQGNFEGSGLVLEDAAGLKEIYDPVIREHRVEEYKDSLIKEALIYDPREYVLRSMADSVREGSLLTRESLGSITKPTLIMWGSEDKTIDVKYADVWADHVKGSVLEIIPGAEHVAHYTHAGTVADLLLRFIRAE